MQGSKEQWDLEQVYDEQIQPLMAQIIEICKAEHLPFVADFQYKSDPEDGDDHCTSACLPASRQISETLECAYDVVKPRTMRRMRLTVRDKDGNPTQITEILS